MAQELPYKCEYAKSGRAGCKGCKIKIDQGVLRLAVMVQSAFHDGKQPNWFHSECFFKKQRPVSETLFDGFPKLRIDDQKYIKENITSSVSCVVPEPKAKGKGKKRAANEGGTSKAALVQLIKDFSIEYAKSGRSTCPGCLQKIPKDEIRIKKIAHDTEIGMKFGGQAISYHVDCFAQMRTELGWLASADILPGFTDLSKADKANVLKSIPAIKQDEDGPSVKKLKSEGVDEVDAALEKTIEKQNKEYFKLRDSLQMETNKSNWVGILLANKQHIPEGNSEVLDHLTDVITYGALGPCDRCKNGKFIFGNSAYLCTGDLSEWAKCDNIVKEPKRVAIKIPKAIKDAHPFLNKRFKVQTRAVKYVPPVPVFASKAKKEEADDVDEPRIKRDKPPLYNMEFVIIGKTEKHKDDIKKLIQRMGGKLGTRIHEKVAAIISTDAEVKRMGSRMQEAKDFGIQVIPEEFFDDVKNGGAISYITSKSLCDWGTDPHTRIPQDDLTKSKSKSIYTKSVPKSQKLKLKNGAAVDPDSGLEDVAHVYQMGKIKYFAILGVVDIAADKNSYYKIQLLESDKKHKYWVFRSWGRISTSIGSSKLDKCTSLDDALQLFEKHYEEKTGNYFGEKKFVKYPGKYYKLDIDYGEEKQLKKMAESNIKSKLAEPVQKLIKLLFDVNEMKKTMLEFHLDMEKMPLGKLSQKQLMEAMGVLKKIAELVKTGTAAPAHFVEQSNRFYTLVPHDFGVQRPPLIDTNEQVATKTEMIESLMEMELAYGLLSEGDDDVKKSPIDSHYEQLKTHMEPIAHNSEEFALLKEYVKNTHGATHDNFELDIEDIFKVARKGEERRYKPFKKLSNRQLLWHGSRLTNYVGILSHGLKIAPPEAPATGYMFGKGIYFADMVSKSANYCFTSKQNSTGLLMLCEVALGDTMDCYKANYVTQLPKDKQSVKGVGKYYPNPDETHTRSDGVKLPLGKPVTDNNIKSSLLYNEYIVYDIAQVKVDYLFKMNFKYKN